MTSQVTWSSAGTDATPAEQADAVTYSGYLRLPDLLASQHPVAVPPAHDEFMFIVVHQAYELWFRLLLHELTAARDAMLAGDPFRARLVLDRCQVVERVMTSQVDVLDTMPATGFRQFRPALGRASGLQSAQFREIEFLSGWKDPRYLRSLVGLSDAERRRLRERLEEPSLWEAFLGLVAAAGLPVADPARRRESLVAVTRGEGPLRELSQLAEGLLNHDQAWSLWRGRHAVLAERQLGGGPGTAGSTGVHYLQSRDRRHFYPDLWELRSEL